MSQNPNMATFLTPGIIGLTSPLCAIFLARISEPASPKPRASKAPILIIAFSIRTVSNSSLLLLPGAIS